MGGCWGDSDAWQLKVAFGVTQTTPAAVHGSSDTCKRPEVANTPLPEVSTQACSGSESRAAMRVGFVAPMSVAMPSVFSAPITASRTSSGVAVNDCFTSAASKCPGDAAVLAHPAATKPTKHAYTQ